MLVVDPTDKENIAAAIGIIAAAVSGGTRTRATHRRTDTEIYDAEIQQRITEQSRNGTP